MSELQKTRKVYLDFVGCRLNQAEIERMGRQFTARGDELVESVDDADLVVVNTCAVTTSAGKSSRKVIRQAARANPATEIVATGCYAEVAPETVARLPNVQLVVGNAEKDDLVAAVRGGAHAADDPAYEVEPLVREPLPPGTLGRTRAFVKVQDGCDNKCTFCVTTLARGAGRSRPPEAIIREIQLLHEMGYQEAVLTGVHLGSYGADRDDAFDLFQLVRAVLLRTDIPRVRLSSLEPWDLVPDFFDLWQDARLCAHLHLPLQSGCDATLRRMARRTTQRQFAALVDAARARIPQLAVTTDVIVGFPGETDDEFNESLAYVTEMNFARLHVFPYSKRPGTAAARMPGHVPHDVKKERVHRMMAVSDEGWQAFLTANVGRRVAVLWESMRGATPDGAIWSGLAGNYLRVETVTRESIGNTITPVQVTGVREQVAQGELVG